MFSHSHSLPPNEWDACNAAHVIPHSAMAFAIIEGLLPPRVCLLRAHCPALRWTWWCLSSSALSRHLGCFLLQAARSLPPNSRTGVPVLPCLSFSPLPLPLSESPTSTMMAGRCPWERILTVMQCMVDLCPCLMICFALLHARQSNRLYVLWWNTPVEALQCNL